MKHPECGGTAGAKTADTVQTSAPSAKTCSRYQRPEQASAGGGGGGNCPEDGVGAQGLPRVSAAVLAKRPAELPTTTAAAAAAREDSGLHRT